MSLIELLIASGLLAVVLFFAGQLLLFGQKKSSSLLQRGDFKNQLELLDGYIKRFLVSGDSLFFAFTQSSPQGTTPEKSLARALIPLPCRNADLSEVTSNCENSMAFSFIHYDKTTTPAAVAICAVPETSQSGDGELPFLRILIDTRNTSLGVPTFTSQGPSLEISAHPSGTQLSPTGRIRLDEGRVVALLEPPIGTLWVSSGQAGIYAEGLDQNGQPGANFPQDCVRNLGQSEGSPTPYTVDASSLVWIRLRPLSLARFTGGNYVGPTNGGIDHREAYFRAQIGNFPKRLFEVSPRVLGLLQEGGSGQKSVAILACNGEWDCKEPTGLEVKAPGITTLSLEGTFKSALNAPGRLRDDWLFYSQEGSPPQAGAFQCSESGSPRCFPLPVASSDGLIPVIADPTETLVSLSAKRFSLLKHESLSALRFRVHRSAPSPSTEVLNVVFP